MNNEKLNIYIQILLNWQRKINLISNNSIPQIWERHINDSIQLQHYINSTNKNILDLGSGAGFPGMILAICDTSYNHYTLVDSNLKKTTFLNVIKAKLNLQNVTIINDRIENLYNKIKSDYIISRGLTNLERLLEYSNIFLKNNGIAIFLKGENLANEIKNIKNKNLLTLFSFDFFYNKLNNKGKILIVKRNNYEHK